MNSIRFTSRAFLLGSVALAALAAQPALAQVEQEQLAQADAGAVRQNERADLTNQEIVVTAQKRAEDQQDVPISISVVNGQALVDSGAAQLTEIAGYVPGLHVSNIGAIHAFSERHTRCDDAGGVLEAAVDCAEGGGDAEPADRVQR